MSEYEMLKPCPFCGGEAEQYRESCGYWRVYCANDDCLVQVDVTDPSQEEAIAAWNTRAGEHAAYERGKAEGAAAERRRIARLINIRLTTIAINYGRSNYDNSAIEAGEDRALHSLLKRINTDDQAE